MEIFYLIIDTLAITLLLLIASSFVLSAPKPAIAWLVALIAVNYTCYLLSARHDWAYFIPPYLQLDLSAVYIPVNLARNSISALFMLLSHMLFRENRRFPPTLIVLMVAQLILEEPLAWILGLEWQAANRERAVLLFEVLPAALQASFTIIALYWAILERKTDLVEARRAVRLLMLTVLTIQGMLSLTIERIGFMTGLIPVGLTYPIHMLLVSIQVFTWAVIVFWLLRRDLLDFLIDRPTLVEPERSPIDTESREVERIVAALENERIYQEMGLTVAGLAKHIGIPEYRLRNLIHNRLGYRNFNAFLHHYRIKEVADALQDPTRNQTPILTLALSAGYQSINPFNRAFKELNDMTPSEYRINSQG